MKKASWTNRFTKPLAALLGVVALLTLAACGGGGTGTTSPQTSTGSLSVSPSTVVMDFGSAPVTLIVSGGVKPYALTSSLPALIFVTNTIAEDGRFTITPLYEPDIATLVTLTIRDGQQGTTTAQITVNARKVLPLSISPSSATTVFGVPVAYQISGGVAPYTVTSSFPTIVADPTVDANGRFVITPLINPPASVNMVLTVRDSAGNQVTSQLTITPIPLSVSPTAATVNANVPVTFTITGGSAPYTIISSQPSLIPNPASVDAQGRFTLIATSTPRTPTEVLITIRDAAQNIVTVTMTVLPNTPIPLTVLPPTAIVYFNTPATLTIFGGTPPYQAFSSNSVVLPVARNVVGDQILLAPANVDVETTVTITVTDSSGTSVTATVIVKPAPLLNTLTITPTPASPGVGCGSAVCAGQTASVTVLVRNLAGAGIQGRAVRFENVQGNYQFLTNGPGLPETLANSITVTTGQDGLAVVRLKADVNAPTQVALIRVTELTSGNVLNGSFVIAQFTDGAGTLTAIPTTWTVTGPNSSSCAANTPVTYYIFGGTPPYRIQSTLPNFADIVPTLVQTNGGGFTAILTGLVCSPAPGVSITITDATGRTIAVQLINSFGTGNPPTTFDAIQIVPGDVFAPVLGCGQSITEQIVGGNIRLADGTITQATFVVSTLGPGVMATLAGRIITVTRTNPVAPATSSSATSPAIVYVSNGFSLVSFQVAVATTCGTAGPPAAVIEFAPSPLPVACAIGSTGTSTISGATGSLTATTLGALTPSISGSILTVTRTSAVVAGSPSIPVIVSNGTVFGTLMVAPPGTCAP